MSGESYTGLIDGVQAIVLTLLLLEMPDLIIEAIEKGSAHELRPYRVAFIVFQQLTGYLLIAISIYDIWSIHKSIVQNVNPSRLCSISTLAALWLSTLIPPIFYLLEHYAQTLSLSAMTGETHGPSTGALFTIRSIALFLFFLIYSILLNLTNNELQRQGDSSKRKKIKRQHLKPNRALLRRRCFAITLLITISTFIYIKTGAMALLLPSLVLAVTILIPPYERAGGSHATRGASK